MQTTANDQAKPRRKRVFPVDVEFVERVDINSPARAQQRLRGSLKAAKKPTTKQRIASKVYNLRLDVAALRQEVDELTLHRSLLLTRAKYTQRSGSKHALKTTVAYWDAFKRGSSRPAAERWEFVQQWGFYAEYFTMHSYKMHSVRVVATHGATGACVTRSDGVFCGMFTRLALEKMFPSVLKDPQLTRRLLRLDFVTAITLVLQFNAEGKWVRREIETDFLPVLVEALDGDGARAAAILEDANLTSESPVEATRDINVSIDDHDARSSSSSRGERPPYDPAHDWGVKTKKIDLQAEASRGLVRPVAAYNMFTGTSGGITL